MAMNGRNDKRTAASEGENQALINPFAGSRPTGAIRQRASVHESSSHQVVSERADWPTGQRKEGVQLDPYKINASLSRNLNDQSQRTMFVRPSNENQSVMNMARTFDHTQDRSSSDFFLRPGIGGYVEIEEELSPTSAGISPTSYGDVGVHRRAPLLAGQSLRPNVPAPSQFFNPQYGEGSVDDKKRRRGGVPSFIGRLPPLLQERAIEFESFGYGSIGDGPHKSFSSKRDGWVRQRRLLILSRLWMTALGTVFALGTIVVWMSSGRETAAVKANVLTSPLDDNRLMLKVKKPELPLLVPLPNVSLTSRHTETKVDPENPVLHSIKHLEEEFEEWMQLHNREYHNPEEKKKRFHIWAENHHRTMEKNKLHGHCKLTKKPVFGSNHFKDLAPEEFKQKYLTGYTGPHSDRLAGKHTLRMDQIHVEKTTAEMQSTLYGSTVTEVKDPRFAVKRHPDIQERYMEVWNDQEMPMMGKRYVEHFEHRDHTIVCVPLPAEIEYDIYGRRIKHHTRAKFVNTTSRVKSKTFVDSVIQNNGSHLMQFTTTTTKTMYVNSTTTVKYKPYINRTQTNITSTNSTNSTNSSDAGVNLTDIGEISFWFEKDGNNCTVYLFNTTSSSSSSSSQRQSRKRKSSRMFPSSQGIEPKQSYSLSISGCYWYDVSCILRAIFYRFGYGGLAGGTLEPAYDADSYPNGFDWRSFGAITDIHSQGGCGACWAITATETVESAYFISTGYLVDLSESEVITCDDSCEMCRGGWPQNAYEYVMAHEGLPNEYEWSYDGDTLLELTYGLEGESESTTADDVANYRSARCPSGGNGNSKDQSSSSAKRYGNIKGYGYATDRCLCYTDGTGCDCDDQNEALAFMNLATYGPVTVCLDASTWQDYEGGIITADSGCSSKFLDMNHCVQAVGYAFTDVEEEDEDGEENSRSKNSGSGDQQREGYWIVRNQWSSNWGMYGYAYVAMGSNTCGILNDATQVYM